MLALVIGGSGSGKSAYAEELLGSISGDWQKYYLAAMEVFDEEGKEKIARHQRLRAGKRFLTIEQPRNIADALEKMDAGNNTALLECLSNLTANEMFSGEVPIPGKIAEEKVLKDVERLAAGLKHLVIVGNNVFEDGYIYDDTTMEYIRAMGHIQQELAAMADLVVEVVVGIPLPVKGSLKDISSGDFRGGECI